MKHGKLTVINTIKNIQSIKQKKESNPNRRKMKPTRLD